jgi:hypothetical protein
MTCPERDTRPKGEKRPEDSQSLDTTALLFYSTFNRRLTPAQVFDDTLATFFNSQGGGHLSVENLKGATGVVALQLGAEHTKSSWEAHKCHSTHGARPEAERQARGARWGRSQYRFG